MLSLAKHEKMSALSLARRAIERKLSGSGGLEPCEIPVLQAGGGAFVSLQLRGELRGCIGRIRSPDPLYRTIQEMAVAAALQDYRFTPVQFEEIAHLRLEISLLSEAQEIQDPEQIQVGVHGLIVSVAGRSGLLLPQVALEYAWDRETFLTHTCLKAGLPGDYWQSGLPKIEIFTAEVFSEHEENLHASFGV
ncbi:MAG TPA: AMMECR1 domain-containing protein [Deltaproteobacteria bacterium]|nr:AMMECR1 domain-containing protein [Deltaproteobacteria bacterium]